MHLQNANAFRFRSDGGIRIVTYMPRVSVILPAFNAENTITRAVRSVLDQTFSDLELIVVDDGSSDQTVERLQQISDDRLTVVEIEHSGVVTASNTALSVADGELISRMDADDECHPEKIRKQVELLDTEDFGAVGCQVSIVSQLGQEVESLERYQRWINEETLSPEQIYGLRFVELPLVNPTILALRSYFGNGYQESCLPEDYDLFLDAAARGVSFGKVPEKLFCWTDGAGRLTRTDSRYRTESFEECRRHHLVAGPLADVDHVDLWGGGQTGKRWLRWLQSRGTEVRRILEVNPRKIGQAIHGVPVIDYAKMPQPDGTLLIAAVGADRARQMIWPFVERMGYRVGDDVLFVA